MRCAANDVDVKDNGTVTVENGAQRTAPTPTETGWKDTVYVNGDVVELVVTFAGERLLRMRAGGTGAHAVRCERERRLLRAVPVPLPHAVARGPRDDAADARAVRHGLQQQLGGALCAGRARARRARCG
jgi:hypothetical protein